MASGVDNNSVNAQVEPVNDGNGAEIAPASEPRTGKQLWKAGAFKVKSSVGMSMAFKTLRTMHSDDFIPPSRLQRVKRLGEGAFGVVDLAWFTPNPTSSHKVMVAVKQLKPEVFNKPEDLEMFLKEVNLMKRISHPCLVDLVGVGALEPVASDSSAQPDQSQAANGKGDAGGDKNNNAGGGGGGNGEQKAAAVDRADHMYVVQEYMAAGTLKNMVLKQQLAGGKRVYGYQDAIRWCRQVAKGLSYLHTAQPMIIHRDLKLENILLKGPKIPVMVAKVADFGLCACVDSWMEKRKTGQGHAHTHASVPPTLATTPEDAVAPQEPLTPPEPNAPTTTGTAAAASQGADSPADAADGGTATTVSSAPPSAPASTPSAGGEALAPAIAGRRSSFTGSEGTASADGSTGAAATGHRKGFRRGLSSALARAFSRKAAAPPINQTYHLSGHTGSLMYMAPEVYRTEPYNEKVDVFSFALILLEVFMGMVLVTFTAPNGFESEIERYAQRVAEEGYRPTIPFYIPEPVAQLIQQCWEADPAARPRMEDVARRLKEIEDSGMMLDLDLAKSQAGCACFGSGAAPKDAAQQPAAAV